MSQRLLVVLVIVSLTAIPALGQTSQAAKAPASAAKAWTQSKTPWGDPDLQGTWTSDDYIGVPLQRAQDAGTRLLRSDAEIATAQQNIERTTERNAQEFQNPNAQITVNPPGHWGEGARRPAMQTSMIIV